MHLLRSILLTSALASGFSAAPLSSQQADIIFRNGRVLDGSGSPWMLGDVAIQGDRIVGIGRLEGWEAPTEIDIDGLFLAPGFIDPHSHASEGLTAADRSHAEPLLAQGITTAFVNPDGGGAVDLAAQRADLVRDGLGVNVAQLVSHGSIRGEVIGSEDRLASAAELDSMRGLVRRGMEEGAFGLSSGPFYAPGSFSDTRELVELTRVVSEYGGVYTSHIRDESDYSIGLIAAVDEVITIAREAGVRGIVTHVKALGPRVWGYSAAISRRIERARGDGVEVFTDQYPYDASATSLGAALVPRWAQEGGSEAMRQRFADAELLPRLLEEMAENLDRRGGADRIQFRRHQPDPSIEGRTLANVAQERGIGPVRAAIQLLEEGSPGIVSFNMDDRDIAELMRQPWNMTSSDGELPVWEVGVPHPRAYGSFPRKLRLYVMETGAISLEEAIRSMTSLTASVHRMGDRGMIRPGNMADLVVFDLARVRDLATFTEPHQLSEGMVHVLVNGEFAIRDGAFTGAMPGQVLRMEP